MSTPTHRIARLILTVELILGVFLSFLLDWSANHLLSPSWHPHARFPWRIVVVFSGGSFGNCPLATLATVTRTTACHRHGRYCSRLLFGLRSSTLASVLPGSSSVGWKARRRALSALGVELLPNLGVALIFIAAAVVAQKDLSGWQRAAIDYFKDADFFEVDFRLAVVDSAIRCNPHPGRGPRIGSYHCLRSGTV